MKKILFLLLILFASGCNKKDQPTDPRANDYVYVCTSNSSETYHTFRDCGKLKQCRQDILEVTRHKAQENERIVCINCKKREEEVNKKRDSLK